MRSIISTLLVAALLAAIAHAQISCPSGGVNNTVCSSEGSCINYPTNNSYCACASGSSGNNCATAVAGTCPFNNVSFTSTSNIPIAALASFTNDRLTVVVTSPLVTERGYSTLALGTAQANNESCTYPGTYWTRDFNGCADRFTGVMPWADTLGCGWALNTSDLEYFTYDTDMILVHHDFIDPFGGRTGQAPVERLTQHVIPLEVQFQKFIDVSTDITVQSPVRLLIAITRQEVAANTQTAIIEVTTNLLWPYRLTAEQLTLVPSATYPGMNFTIVDVSNAAQCPNTNGSACTQVFRINIAIGSNCQITGNYGIGWNLDCQLTNGNRPAECAIQAGATASAALSILSEDFCAKVSVKVQITGSLNSFDSATYLTAKTQYIVNQTTYFRAQVVSPDATLQSSTVRSVKLVSTTNGQTDTVLLYSDGSVTNPSADFQLDQSGADFAEFFFTLRDSFVGDIAADSSKTFSVVARIDVTFTGVPGVKRLIMQGALNNKPMALNAQIGVTAPLVQNQQPGGGLDNSAAGLALSGLAAAAAAAMLH